MIVRRNVAHGSDFKVVMAALLTMGPWLVSCEPLALSCAETATCPPPPDASADAGRGVDADAGLELDAHALPDVAQEWSIDSPRDDVASTDAAGEAPSPPRDVLGDVVGEPGDGCDTSNERSPADTPCLIDARYGVFVSPVGNDNPGGGTPIAPYKTLAYAMGDAKKEGKRVYVCDDGAGYAETLAVGTVVDGLRLYGGFACGNWTYSASRRARVRPSAGSALVVRGLVTGVTLEDFELSSADGAPGASSIAAIVEASAHVTLRGVKLTAGKAGYGADGVDGVQALDPEDVRLAQRGKAGACSVDSQSGGEWPGPSACSSIGGAGGQATKDTTGTNGLPGGPRTGVIDPEPDTNNGGLAGAFGVDGTIGSEGHPGPTGKPNPASGTFSALGYVVAAPGGAGVAGNAGQGGGGGGASHAPSGSGCTGASGGAGGMGGCGGLQGTGGSSGGASVALLSWMSQIALERCELSSSDGGAGGKGGNGSAGTAGKSGAVGGDEWTPDGGMTIGKAGSGGTGGHGGNGGSGAGGNGGPSHALVYKGTAPIKGTDTMLVYGAGGAKGTGGTLMSAKALDGVAGGASEELMLP